MKLVYRCSNNMEVSIILHALAAEGIHAFEGETGTSAVYPLPNFGPTIYVRMEDEQSASQIIKQLELSGQKASENESFREVNKKEIEYIKEINEPKRLDKWIWVLFAILLFGLIGIYLKNAFLPPAQKSFLEFYPNLPPLTNSTQF